jgi:hypothetical protein
MTLFLSKAAQLHHTSNLPQIPFSSNCAGLSDAFHPSSLALAVFGGLWLSLYEETGDVDVVRFNTLEKNPVRSYIYQLNPGMKLMLEIPTLHCWLRLFSWKEEGNSSSNGSQFSQKGQPL